MSWVGLIAACPDQQDVFSSRNAKTAAVCQSQVDCAEGLGGNSDARDKASVSMLVSTSSLIVQSVRIFGFHPEDPGSIPGRGATFLFLHQNLKSAALTCMQTSLTEKYWEQSGTRLIFLTACLYTISNENLSF